MKKTVRFFLISVFCLTSLTACETKYGSIPDEQEVLEKVNATIENENFELVGKEEVDSSPKKCIYTFKSTDRDLEFTAIAGLSEKKLLGSGHIGYLDKIEVNYSEAVAGLYKDKIIEVLNETGFYNEEEEIFVIQSEEQYNAVLEALCTAEQIYSVESEYNSEEWMEHNPAMSVEIDFLVDGDSRYGGVVWFTGVKTNEYIQAEMEKCKAYAER